MSAVEPVWWPDLSLTGSIPAAAPLRKDDSAYTAMLWLRPTQGADV